MVKKKILEAVESTDPKTKRWKSTFAAARMAYESGELRQAETLLARAKEMAHELPERTFAESSTDIGRAAILIATDRAPLAKRELEKAIANLKSHGDAKHKELMGVALRFYAQALADSGDAREAETQLKKSVEVLEALGANAAVQLAYTYCDLSGFYISQQRHSEGEQKITKAMTILGNALGTDSAEYVRADMIYAVCGPLNQECRMETASDGVAKMQYYYGGKHPNISRAVNRYIKVLEERGDKKALEEAKERFGIVAKARK